MEAASGTQPTPGPRGRPCRSPAFRPSECFPTTPDRRTCRSGRATTAEIPRRSCRPAGGASRPCCTADLPVEHAGPLDARAAPVFKKPAPNAITADSVGVRTNRPADHRPRYSPPPACALPAPPIRRGRAEWARLFPNRSRSDLSRPLVEGRRSNCDELLCCCQQAVDSFASTQPTCPAGPVRTRNRRARRTGLIPLLAKNGTVGIAVHLIRLRCEDIPNEVFFDVVARQAADRIGESARAESGQALMEIARSNTHEPDAPTARLRARTVRGPRGEVTAADHPICPDGGGGIDNSGHLKRMRLRKNRPSPLRRRLLAH